jgi:hypothetical protein
VKKVRNISLRTPVIPANSLECQFSRVEVDW